MIVLIKGALESLDYFIDCIDAELAEKHICIDVNSLDDVAYFSRMDKQIDDNTIVFTFNCVGLGFYYNDENYWISKHAIVYSILVDHPFYYADLIKKYNFADIYYVCIDKGHALFLKEMFPTRADNFLFMPHGGIGTECEDVNRDIDILYVGSCQDPRIFLDTYSDPAYADFLNFLDNYYETTKFPEGALALLDLFNGSANLENSATFSSLMTLLLAYEEARTARRRIKLIAGIARSGLNITVAGPGIWEEMQGEMPENYTYLGYITPKKCVELMARAKIVINDLPYFSYGAHERVFNGILSGAVVFTNQSAYLEERFDDGVDIIYWDGKNVEYAVNKLEEVLSNEDYLNDICTNALSKTQNDSWADRIRHLLEYGKVTGITS